MSDVPFRFSRFARFPRETGIAAYTRETNMEKKKKKIGEEKKRGEEKRDTDSTDDHGDAKGEGREEGRKRAWQNRDRSVESPVRITPPGR